MNIKIKEQSLKTSLEKTSLVLFGVFLSTLSLAGCISLLKEWGVLLGIVVNIGVSILAIKKLKNPTINLICYGAIGTIIIVAVLYFIAINSIQQVLQDL